LWGRFGAWCGDVGLPVSIVRVSEFEALMTSCELQGSFENVIDISRKTGVSEKGKKQQSPDPLWRRARDT